MSVTRIVEVLQPASVRTASLISDVTSTVSRNWQSFLRRTMQNSEEAADVLVALVTPAAVLTLVMGLWRLTADLGWTETFPISTGFFSHWQVWIVLATGLKSGASALAAKLIKTEAHTPAENADHRA